jgi:N-acetylmuramoyl-L-alanine amidase
VNGGSIGYLDVILGAMRKYCLKHIALFFLIGLLLSASQGVCNAAGNTVRTRYYAAERCYRDLRNDPGRQKYRDQWLHCINRFMDAYKHNPKDPWASASLYQAGVLYVELHKLSYRKSDKQEALDLFERLIRHYPNSSYRRKAHKQKLALVQKQKKPKKQPPAAQKPKQAKPEARTAYKRAQNQYQRLQQKPRLKKYRDQWFKSIDNYRKAFQTDPDGPLAAAALYGLARSYAEMYEHSYLPLDLTESQRMYAEIVKEYPRSPYADKARAVLDNNQRQDSGDDDGQDVVAAVIEKVGETRQTSQVEVTHTMSTGPAVVEGLRYWSNPRYTRVVIDASQDTGFTYHELREDPSIGKPQRIYVDVLNSRLSSNLQKVVAINDNLLTDARAGQYTPNTVRVVVDIKSFETFKIFSLKNPFRIVLDVWGTDAGAGATTTARNQDGKLPPSAIVKQLALGVRRIVIDPGHGGKDYGAPGYVRGVHEKEIVLQIGKRLGSKIQKELNCEVVLTRKGDSYLSLEERTAIANTQNADLFISIHTNASANKKAFGIETYILNLATDDEAIRVAARENATSAKNISDLDSILQDLMKNTKVSESTRLASYVQQDMIGSLKSKYSNIHSKGVKQAPFYVLLGAQMPSILIETSFISNPRECKRLKNSHYQDLLCDGIIKGIKRYIEETNPVAADRFGAVDESG